MGISRQAYYKRNRAYAARLVLDQKVADFVTQKRLRQPRMGTRKLHYLMHCQPQHELQVGRDRLFSILRERRLLVARKRAYHKTTDSHHRFRRHPNLLNRVLIRLFQAARNKSGWLTLPICPPKKVWPI